MDPVSNYDVPIEIDFFNQKLMKRILVHLSEMLFEGSLVEKWRKARLTWKEYFSGSNLRTIHNLNAKNKTLPYSTMNRRVDKNIFFIRYIFNIFKKKFFFLN